MICDFPLLIFDWDGTIVDSQNRIVASVSHAIHELGLPPRTAPEIRDIIGLSLREATESLYPGRGDELHLEFTHHYRRHFFGDESQPVTVFEGVPEGLHVLRGRGHTLAVATGKGGQSLTHEMQRAGLTSVFDAVRCADDAPSKPHPAMVQELMEELGYRPAETLVIGDTAYDLEMAQNAGVRSVGVRTGVHDHQRLIEFDPISVLDSAAGLPSWLDEI